MDWNWFFSGFAQCAAALIGITSAFIISKLIGTGDNIEQIDRVIINLIIQAKSLKKKASKANFDWYCKTHINESGELKKAITNGEFEGLDNEDKQKKLLELIPQLIKNPKNISYLNSVKVELDSDTYKLTVVSIEAEKLRINKLERLSREYWDLKYETEKLLEQLDNLFNDISALSKRFNSLRNIIFILGISFITTVVYPLHFLPLEIGVSPKVMFSFNAIFDFIFSFKGIMIYLLTISIGGMFIYFLYQLKKMKYNCLEILSKKNAEIMNIEDYNPCF